MNPGLLNRTAVATIAAALGLLVFVSVAGAAQLTLACGGKGPRNADSAGTVLCAAAPGKARTLTGVARDDAGKPVAAKLSVTLSDWIPNGDGSFSIKPVSTQTIVANSQGSFSLPVKTSTRVSLKFETVADSALDVSAVSAEAQVSRRLEVKVKKLGGGKVRLSVKGAGKIPLKLYVLDPDGYELPGVKPKSGGKSASATFNLGSRTGLFSYYVDAGDYGDLFWAELRPTFKL